MGTLIIYTRYLVPLRQCNQELNVPLIWWKHRYANMKLHCLCRHPDLRCSRTVCSTWWRKGLQPTQSVWRRSAVYSSITSPKMAVLLQHGVCISLVFHCAPAVLIHTKYYCYWFLSYVALIEHHGWVVNIHALYSGSPSFESWSREQLIPGIL